MKSTKIVSYVCIFAAVIFLGDRLLAFLATQVVRHSRNQFVRMYEGKLPAKILFLGDSRIDRNIDIQKANQLTGKLCLQLGLGGNSVLISEVLLKDFVQRYGKPEVVVIELSHTTANPDSMGEMRVFSYCSINITALAKRIDPTYARFESVFKILRFNDPAFWRLSMEAFMAPASRLLDNTIPQEIQNRWKDGHQIKFPIFKKNMKALGRICNYAAMNDITIRFVIGPSWREFKNGISNYEQWKSELQKAVGQYIIHDYTELFFDHSEYFDDEMHLNVHGADHFVQKLVEDKILPELTNDKSHD